MCVCVCVCVCVQSFSHVWLFATLWTVAPPDSPVHGISQTRILQWVVISSSRGSSRSRDQIPFPCIFCTGGRILYTVSPGHTLTVPIFSGIIKSQSDERCWFAECELTRKSFFFPQTGKERDWIRIEPRGLPMWSSGWWLRICTSTLCTLSCFSRVRLCDPKDYSTLGFSVHAILQARILEWAAISSSRGSYQPWDQGINSIHGWGSSICCAVLEAKNFFNKNIVQSFCFVKDETDLRKINILRGKNNWKI